jgi:hypothetical protein
MTEVPRILSAIDQGDPQAAGQLLPLVYDELRRLAAQRLVQEKPGQTLQATALVHEAYLRLLDPERSQDWKGYGNDSRQNGPLSSQILHFYPKTEFALYVETRTRRFKYRDAVVPGISQRPALPPCSAAFRSRAEFSRKANRVRGCRLIANSAWRLVV